ncbi:hypothetical protein SDC9_131250 [bioreactor metagenome]|uniref:Uncharacterized protein n=1 Tax=bioreactor metagenome TaxID=1076179 RepID=A0A645D4P3_9ZZZZ
MWHDICVIRRDRRTPGIHRVGERQQISNLFEYTADQVQVKPRSAEPCGEVRQQGAADAANLFVVEHAAAKQTDADEEQRGRQ